MTSISRTIESSTKIKPPVTPREQNNTPVRSFRRAKRDCTISMSRIVVVTLAMLAALSDQCLAWVTRPVIVGPRRIGAGSTISTGFARALHSGTDFLQAYEIESRTEIDQLRSLLDGAVALYRPVHADQIDLHLEEIESLVCDVAAALNEALKDRPLTSSNRLTTHRHDRGLSQQLDQAILRWGQGTSDGKSDMVQIESLAQQYYYLCIETTLSADEDKLSSPESQIVHFGSRLEYLKQCQHQGTRHVIRMPKPAVAVNSIETTIDSSGNHVSDKSTTVGVPSHDESSEPDKMTNAVYNRIVASATENTSSESFDAGSSSGNDDTARGDGEVSIAPYRSGSQLDNSSLNEPEEVDVAIVGAGIGGLCAGAILNTLYGKKVGVYESHYLAGGCAHAFDRVSSNGDTFTFDSGPTILLGCSSPPFNPLRQILDAVQQDVEWIPYDGWGMIERPSRVDEKRWKFKLGPDVFEEGPLKEFGGGKALQEFSELREKTAPLVRGAVDIPAMAMRPGNSALIPLLRHLPALVELLQQGDLNTGVFAPFIDGPLYTVTDPWLRSWLDALAFSLSGLPASRTAAAAMAYVLFDMHRPEASLDYPKGGLGSVVDALVKAVEQNDNGSKVNLRRRVESIDFSRNGKRATGLTLRGERKVLARDGVVCNVPVWSIRSLIKHELAYRTMNGYLPESIRSARRRTWNVTDEGSYNSPTRPPSTSNFESFFSKTETAEMTGSFLHVHLAIKADGLDLNSMEAHYTVMDRGLTEGPCDELNMIAVSNPCVIDRSLAPEGYIIVHAYGAGNEPYSLWKGMKRDSPEYQRLKEERAQVLYRAVESIIPDLEERVVIKLVGSPLTHERFLRRIEGTYGAATEDYLRDGGTPIENLVLAGDSIFPGIGIPAVALNGASAANSLVSPFRQWQCLDRLKL